MTPFRVTKKNSQKTSIS